MLTVVTPTGGRPEALTLLGRRMNEQTMQRFRWLICDDCDPASPVPEVREGIDLCVVRPNWRWRPGENTQARSMALLLEGMSGPVVVCEDDDYYAPDHLQVMADALATHDLVGQRVSHYYNVATRRYREMPCQHHASLGCSAFTSSALDLLHHICETQRDRLDITLWRSFRGRKAQLETCTSVGIKGMPGRAGIGVGHRATFGVPAPGMLQELCGEAAHEYQALA